MTKEEFLKMKHDLEQLIFEFFTEKLKKKIGFQRLFGSILLGFFELWEFLTNASYQEKKGIFEHFLWKIH